MNGPRVSLFVSGYPRSGNTWLSRLLGDVLDSPVASWNGAKPLADEGLDRPGPFVIYHLHLMPVDKPDDDRLILSPYLANVRNIGQSGIIHIVRDPRDVVVSAWFYWGIKTLDLALEAVARGIHPLGDPWPGFVRGWLNCHNERLITVRFCDLLSDTAGTLTGLLAHFDIDTPDRLPGAIERQSFAVRRKEIEQNGDRYTYGRDIQLRAIRKGIAGDWRNYFDDSQRRRAAEYFGELMTRLGYEI